MAGDPAGGPTGGDDDWRRYDKWRTPPMHLRWIGLAIFVAAVIRYLTM